MRLGRAKSIAAFATVYAHALTLQEMIRNGGSTTYDDLRPRYDRQAEQQFEIFSRSFAPDFRK